LIPSIAKLYILSTTEAVSFDVLLANFNKLNKIKLTSKVKIKYPKNHPTLSKNPFIKFPPIVITFVVHMQNDDVSFSQIPKLVKATGVTLLALFTSIAVFKLLRKIKAIPIANTTKTG